MTYSEQYKDPRWQKKRLEIMQRDEFKCRSCGDKNSTLNVHHAVPYKKDKFIWEYENSDLLTLCEDCHTQISDNVSDCKIMILKISTDVVCSEYLVNIVNLLQFCNPPELEKIFKYINKL